MPDPKPHYVIRTAEGWKPLLPPLAPTPQQPKWWHFSGSSSYDSLFIDGAGEDMRVTRNRRRADV